MESFSLMRTVWSPLSGWGQCGIGYQDENIVGLDIKWRQCGVDYQGEDSVESVIGVKIVWVQLSR